MDTNIRHSHQREMIYDFIMTSKEHPTADMIYTSLKTKEKNLSLGTVYRNLKLLESLGKIKKVISLDNVEHYDYDCSNHAHFICEKCNTIIDLDDVDIEAIKDICSKHTGNNKINTINLTISGICSKCSSDN